MVLEASDSFSSEIPAIISKSGAYGTFARMALQSFQGVFKVNSWCHCELFFAKQSPKWCGEIASAGKEHRFRNDP
jgi:hypothetical protein